MWSLQRHRFWMWYVVPVPPKTLECIIKCWILTFRQLCASCWRLLWGEGEKKTLSLCRPLFSLQPSAVHKTLAWIVPECVCAVGCTAALYHFSSISHVFPCEWVDGRCWLLCVFSPEGEWPWVTSGCGDITLRVDTYYCHGMHTFATLLSKLR